MSDERRRPRARASGVRAAHRSDGLKTTAVVCAAEDGPLAEGLRRHFSDPDTLVVVPDREALAAAKRSIPCACLVALSSRPRIEPVKELARSLKVWPMARLVWFERYARPEAPSGAEGRVPLATLTFGPFHEDVDHAVALLIREIELGLGQRLHQARLGHRFARHHELPELATRLIVAIAMGVPEPRWADLLGQQPDQSRKYRSRSVYPLLGVSTVAELQSLVWGFERRLDGFQRPGVVEGNGSKR